MLGFLLGLSLRFWLFFFEASPGSVSFFEGFFFVPVSVFPAPSEAPAAWLDLGLALALRFGLAFGASPVEPLFPSCSCQSKQNAVKRTCVLLALTQFLDGRENSHGIQS